MIKIKDQISEFSKNTPVLATTFNFDYKVIDDLICSNKNYRERSIIIADKNFIDSESSFDFNGQGSRYFLYPASKTKDAFHPKTIASIENGIFKLVIGSHNLTDKGINHNLELTAGYSIPIIENYNQLLSNLISFYEGLYEQVPFKNLNDPIGHEIQNFIELLKDPAPLIKETRNEYDIHFIHSINQSIYDQLIEILPPIKKITICSPILSSSSFFITDFIAQFGNKATFLTDSYCSISKERFEQYREHEIKTIDTKGRRLHAKLYVFHSEKGEYVLFGSPNFTQKAFFHQANYGGNVEAAILLPPSKWNWRTLFSEDTFALYKSSWRDILLDEPTDVYYYEIPAIEQWGIETGNGIAIILVNNMPEGTELLVRLIGIDKTIKIQVTNNQISFNIPKNWKNETRFEIFNLEGRKLSQGFINRSGSALRDISSVQLSDESLIRYWFFLRKIQRYKVTNYRRLFKDIPNVALRPEIWVDGSNNSGWSPVANRISRFSHDSVFKLCQKKLDEAYEALKEGPDVDNYDLYIRQFLNAVDLYLEGTFYSTILSNDSKYLVKSFKSLLPLFQVPDMISQKSVWTNNWGEEQLSLLTGNKLEEWRKNCAKFAIPISVLINFWLYMECKKGFSFSRRVDVQINCNRAYHLIQVLKIIVDDRISQTAIDKIWESRIVHLQDKNNINAPRDLGEINNLLELCYERILDSH